MDDIDNKDRSRRDLPSGRFVLRIDPGLHAALREAAAEAGISLNEYCSRKLAAPVGDLAAFQGAWETVGRAAGLFADALVGVAVFGSWARGEESSGSDVDALVVVEARVEIARGLYRRWDEAPVSWDGHEVEPHFVHLPGPEDEATGLWAEVALDGLVLFERDLRLSAHLARVRRDIADGRVVRRTVHGQPYWVRAA